MMARRWRGIGFTVAGLLIALWALAGIVLCEGALRPWRRAVDPNGEARQVEITAGDGARLRGSLFMPAKWNGGAVLVLHGIADSRASQVGFAHLFLSRGYLVLTPNNRAQGESGGEFVTYGLREADDVHRWVSWLIEEHHPREVYGLGESLGGAVLIESLAIEPRFSGIVAECSFASMASIARDRVAERLPLPREAARLVAAPAVWAAFIYARWRYSLDFRNASPEAALAQTRTPVLLIHGLNDTKTPSEHSKILAAVNPRVTTLWLVPGAGHTGAHAAAPKEFEQRVLDFYQNLPPGIQVREK